jgi:hypothetical protein
MRDLGAFENGSGGGGLAIPIHDICVVYKLSNQHSSGVQAHMDVNYPLYL